MKLPDERRLVVMTFCLIALMTFGALLYGLYVNGPEGPDNRMIFPIIDQDFKLIACGADRVYRRQGFGGQ